MFCPKCGRAVEEDSAYCRFCGAGLPSSPVTATATLAPPSANVLKSNVETFELEQAGPLVYAGFWRRCAAAIVDWIVITVLFVLLGLVIGIFGAAFPPGATDNFVNNWGGLLAVLVALLYYPVQECSTVQATFGKRVFNLVVTDGQRRRITFWRALGRYLAKIVSSMTLGIGYLMAGFTLRKQALHDMLADTLVLIQT